MNPYSWMIAYLVARVWRRRCPKCGHRQRVELGKRRDTVICVQCGAEIPPRSY